MYVYICMYTLFTCTVCTTVHCIFDTCSLCISYHLLYPSVCTLKMIKVVVHVLLVTGCTLFVCSVLGVMVSLVIVTVWGITVWTLGPQ